jgi:PTS system mannose-specific IID component
MPSQPDARSLLLCFFRTYLVGGAFNTRGMQNIGLVFALEPGLRAIYPDPVERCRARERYQRHYQTHMFWTPLLVGVFLSLEAKIAKGLFPPQLLEKVKDTTLNTLSAIGDSVFGGTLLVFWALSSGCMTATGHAAWAAAWTVAWFAVLQLFKMATFLAGFREGLTFLQRLKRWDLINWGARLKLVNAALMAWFLYLAWPGVLAWQ